MTAGLRYAVSKPVNVPVLEPNASVSIPKRWSIETYYESAMAGANATRVSRRGQVTMRSTLSLCQQALKTSQRSALQNQPL